MHPFICEMLREWKQSVHGIEQYYDRIPPLEFDYLAQCKEKLPKDTICRVNVNATDLVGLS